MNFLLHLKHWQLFLLMFGIPVAATFILDESIMDIIIPYVLSLMAFTYLGWFLSVARMLHSRLPNTVKLNLKLFYVILSVPFVYFICLFITIGQIKQINETEIPIIFYILIPLHLGSFAAIAYCSYFNSKSIKAVEYQKPVSFGEYLGEFFLFCFLPIGIWIIQPKVNMLYQKMPLHNKKWN